MKKYMWKRVTAGLLVAACLLSTSALAARTTGDEMPAIPAGEAVATSPMEMPVGADNAAQAELFAADLSTGLVGYWTFDGADDTARLTNHATDGSITASVSGSGAESQTENGIDGGSVYFSAQANSPLTLDLKTAGQGLNAATADFTLAAWVNYDADMDSSQRVDLFQLTDGGRTILYVEADGKYGTFLAGHNVAMSATAPVGGRWHHVALTWEYTTNTMTCYVNGKQEVRTVLDGTAVSEATNIVIGTHKSGAVGQAIKGHVDELRYYTKVLSQEDVTALYTYNGYNEIAEAAAELHVTVDPDTVVRDITPAMFGINHRYHKNGYGTWDTTAAEVNETFNAMVKEAGFGSVRWPGGTVSNLFTWKDSIGPMEDRTPTIAGNNFYSDAGEAPVEPGFGLDEAATWICDDLGVEMIYVYGMGRGNAQDAADLVEYLNAPNDGSNPGGGTDWAAVRAENGHPDPYNVTKFEIGNEFTDVGQNYWATPRGTNANQAVEDYIEGGRRNFAGETQYAQHNDRVVKKGDWRKTASFSDGNPNEERYLCYVPVIEGTATIYVDNVQWQIVDTLEGQAADAEVCTLDYETGKITFGDGIHGKIPPQGQQITAHYSSDRDGFAAYSDAMKAIAADIGIEIKVYSGVHDALQSSFITKMHEKDYDDKYDGVIYHPYAGGYTEATYDNVLTQARAYAATIGTLKNQMDASSGYTDKEVAVSEFGINAPGDFTKSLGNALYAANFMIDCVNRGAAYLNRHCLVDFTVGDNLGNWEQAVIQCLGSASSAVSGNDYIATPSAQVFSLFNYMTGNTQVEYTAIGNDNYASGNGQTVQKVNLYATKDDDGNVYVLVVNNQKSDAQKLHLALSGEDLTDRDIEIWTLTSESVMDQNTQAQPDKVTVQKTQTTAEAETLTYTLPAHSITSLKVVSPSTPDDPDDPVTPDDPPDDPVTPDKPTTPSSNTSTFTTTATTKTREDGAKVTTTTKPNGDKVETVEQTDGVKSETVTARNGDKTITVTDPEGKELVKAEIPATIPAPETDFEDIDQTPWAVEAIHNMTALGLVNGVGSGLYDTASPVTRGALATVLYRLSNGKADYKVTFKDVKATKYYTQGVAWAAKAKVVTGYTTEIFAPDDIITREQLAVMMARYAKLIGMDTKADTKSLDAFVDGENTGAWAVDGVAWCVENGILKGKGLNNLDPTANVSRAEVAVMLDRFIALIQK